MRKRMRRSSGTALGVSAELLLHRQRRRDRAGRGLEHRQHRVARHVDDAALVRVDLRAEDGAAASSAATVARSSSAIRRE